MFILCVSHLRQLKLHVCDTLQPDEVHAGNQLQSKQKLL